MFEQIKRLYEQGKLDANGVEAAVKKGWITPRQAQKITGER